MPAWKEYIRGRADAFLTEFTRTDSALADKRFSRKTERGTIQYTYYAKSGSPLWVDVLIKLRQDPLHADLISVYKEILDGYDGFLFEWVNLPPTFVGGRKVSMGKEMIEWLTKEDRLYRSRLLA